MVTVIKPRDDVEGIRGIMEDMSAIGTKAEEVDKSLAIVESMKQELKDRLDECKAMKVNGMHGIAWAEKFKEESQNERVKKYKKSRDRTLAEQIQIWAVRKPVPSGGQMVNHIQAKESENRVLAWAY